MGWVIRCGQATPNTCSYLVLYKNFTSASRYALTSVRACDEGHLSTGNHPPVSVLTKATILDGFTQKAWWCAPGDPDNFLLQPIPGPSTA